MADELPKDPFADLLDFAPPTPSLTKNLRTAPSTPIDELPKDPFADLLDFAPPTPRLTENSHTAPATPPASAAAPRKASGKQKIIVLDWPPIPQDARVYKRGRYLRLRNCHDHELSTRTGEMSYARFVLYEKLGKPTRSKCWHCGYELPWVLPPGKVHYLYVQFYVLRTCHLDLDPANNQLENLVPSCWWCWVNRSWAEQHVEFWVKWRRWLAQVPPAERLDLRMFTTVSGFSLVGRPTSRNAKNSQRAKRPVPLWSRSYSPLLNKQVQLAKIDTAWP